MSTNPNSSVLARSAQAIKDRAFTSPNDLAIASSEEILTTLEFDVLVNGAAAQIHSMHRKNKFLPIVVTTSINSVITYHAAILSRTPVAFLDGSLSEPHLKALLSKLENPQQILLADGFTKPISPNQIENIRFARQPAQEFEFHSFTPDEPAIVIFSSGSTGEPKGSIWSWSNIDDSWRAITKSLPPRPDYRLGRISSVAFAAGAYHMMSATLPHNLHLINPSHSPDKIIEFINEKSLKQIAFSSSFLERICDQRNPNRRLLEVDEILTYGEPVSWEQIQKFRELSSREIDVRASFGASEAPGLILYHTVKPDDGLKSGRIPIGNLNSSDDIALLPNEANKETFELVIHNRVALGYLEEKGLTEEKFGVDPHGRRFFRTGDVVSVSDSGDMSVIGRLDDLIKVNGRLVGPVESEIRLRQLPGIKTVVVLPHEVGAIRKQLVAHLVLEGGSNLTPRDVYGHLLEKLPNYLVPSKLVLHEQLPLGINGKVDRKSLQASSWNRWRTDSTIKKLTQLEEFVLSEMKKILKIDDLMVDEDLFGVGLDSLAALEFQTIVEEFGITSVAPSIFLENRTVKSVAHFMEFEHGALGRNIFRIHTSSELQPIFVFPGAGVSAIYFKEFADSFNPRRPVVVIEPRGLHDMKNIEKSVDEMVSNAAREIIESQPHGEIHLLGHSAGGVIAVSTAIALKKSGRIASVVILDSLDVADQISLSRFHSRFRHTLRRVRSLVFRKPKEFSAAINRRRRATAGNSYEFFQLHLGGLALNYKFHEKPECRILALYCDERNRTRGWQNNDMYTYRKIPGTHLTLLKSQYLPNLQREISGFFGFSSTDK